MRADLTLCNGALAGNLDSNFLQALDISNAVEEWHQDLETGLECSMETTHALNDPGLLLRHKFDDLNAIGKGKMVPT